MQNGDSLRLSFTWTCARETCSPLAGLRVAARQQQPCSYQGIRVRCSSSMRAHPGLAWAGKRVLVAAGYSLQLSSVDQVRHASCETGTVIALICPRLRLPRWPVGLRRSSPGRGGERSSESRALAVPAAASARLPGWARCAGCKRARLRRRTARQAALEMCAAAAVSARAPSALPSLLDTEAGGTTRAPAHVPLLCRRGPGGGGQALQPRSDSSGLTFAVIACNRKPAVQLVCRRSPTRAAGRHGAGAAPIVHRPTCRRLRSARAEGAGSLVHRRACPRLRRAVAAHGAAGPGRRATDLRDEPPGPLRAAPRFLGRPVRRCLFA